jgi:hypothetical protein
MLMLLDMAIDSLPRYYILPHQVGDKKGGLQTLEHLSCLPNPVKQSKEGILFQQMGYTKA